MQRCSVRRILLLTFLSFFIAAAAKAERVALVVGINDYQYAPRLKNPVNDANAVADVLRTIGFDVTLATDLDRLAFEDVLGDFSRKSANASISLVYYAGHGIQVQGTSYLIPSDVKLTEQRDVRKLIPAEDILKDAARAHKLSVVILDACRDNPFTRSLAESFGASRSAAVGRGLSRISDVPRNTLIAYSTSAGDIALDGSGVNSPYAIALAQHLGTPGKDVRMVFGAVRDSVLSLTNQQQEPFIYGSLGGDFLYLHGDADPQGNAALSAASEPDLTTTAVIVPNASSRAKFIDGEFAAWQAAKKSRQWDEIRAFNSSMRHTLYGFVSHRLLEIAQANPNAGIDDAITGLGNIYIDLRQLPPEVVSLVQRKLSAASYYGGAPTGNPDPQTLNAMVEFARDVEGAPTVSYRTLLILAELADSQNVTESLSGRWKGRYFYPARTSGVTDVPFEMDLVLSQGRVSGYVSEPNTFGNQSSENLYATFDGAIYGNQVNWTKTYDGTGGVSHSVQYSGKLDRQNRRIEGTWSIEANWSGKFHIELR